jgi:hypothetical protein
MVDKFKIVPKTAPTGASKGKEEEKKGDDEKKISMGKGYFSLEVAELNGKKVYTAIFRNLIGKTLYQASLTA